MKVIMDSLGFHSLMQLILPLASLYSPGKVIHLLESAGVEKISVKGSEVKVAQSCPTLCDSMHCSLPGSSVHRILQARIMEWVAVPFSRGSAQSRGWTPVSCITGGFLPSEPPGKPKNTGVSSLSILQWIFLTQESNRGLLHCRWILYQLSYHGSLLY